MRLSASSARFFFSFFFFISLSSKVTKKKKKQLNKKKKNKKTRPYKFSPFSIPRREDKTERKKKDGMSHSLLYKSLVVFLFAWAAKKKQNKTKQHKKKKKKWKRDALTNDYTVSSEWSERDA